MSLILRLGNVNNSLQAMYLDAEEKEKKAMHEAQVVSDCLQRRKAAVRTEIGGAPGRRVIASGRKRLVPGAGIEPARSFRNPGF